MSASPPSASPARPAPASANASAREAPGADRRILLLTRQEEQRLAAPLEALRSLEDLEHLLRRMEEQLGIRLRIAPAFGEVRSMRGIRMRFEEQPGLCRKTRQAIPAAIRRGLEKRPGSRLRPAQRPRPAARRLKALNDRKRMSLKTWRSGLQEYRRITPMALFALQAQRMQASPGSLNPWRDWPPRRGSARRLRLHVAEHRLQAEQAGIAQGAQFVEADAGEDFHAASLIGAAQGLLQLAGTAGEGRWRQRWKRCP